MAKVSDILGIIKKIAPFDLAESWDNSGLQVGDPAAEVLRIMVALDATPAVIESALSSECQLLVTHHPLIFKPQKSISTATPQGRLIHSAIRGGLSIIAMHTNYDIAEGGLNDLLAGQLGLCSSAPLRVTRNQELIKLVVFVPQEHLERVRAALLPHGETLGAYGDCSFTASGQGTFTPFEGARPFIGNVGKPEQVAEQRLELLVSRANLPLAVKTLLSEHPYEEPAFDIYPLLNQGPALGLGRIALLDAPVNLHDFALIIAKRLKSTGLRYVGDPQATISKAALCSGSGASLMRAAKRAGADALITGDVKYHEARDAQDLGIALIDAGHFQTEIIMANAVAARLKQMLSQAGDERCEVLTCSLENDPFKYCRQ